MITCRLIYPDGRKVGEFDSKRIKVGFYSFYILKILSCSTSKNLIEIFTYSRVYISGSGKFGIVAPW